MPRHRHPSLAALALFCGVILAPVTANADVCTDIARIGLVDETHSSTFEERLERLFWYSRSKREFTSRDVEQFAGSARIPLGEVVAKAGLSWGKDEYERIKQMDEQQLHTYVHHTLASTFDSRRANEGVTRLVGECLARKGLKAWPSFGPGNLRTPALVVLYDAPPEAMKAPLTVNLRYPEGVVCTHSSQPATQITARDGVPVTLHCSRDRKLEESVLVILNPVASATVINGEVWMPPVKAPEADCAVAEHHTIKLAADKGYEKTRPLGPFCGPVRVKLTATGEAKRNTAGANAWSQIAIFRGTSPGSRIELCSDRKELPAWVQTGLGAACAPFELPARKRETVSLQTIDSAADTNQLKFSIEIIPR